MMSNEDPDPKLSALLQSLRGVKPRDPQRAAEQRASFVAEARKLAPAVSNRTHTRLGMWLAGLTNSKPALRKEKMAMVNILVTLLVALGLVFGGGGAALAASQSAMPDEALYPVKTWSEQVQLQLAGDDEDKVQLMNAFTNRRMEEIRTMLQAGEQVPEPVMTRLEYQLQYMLQLAAGQPEGQSEQALLQLRNQLQIQNQLMQQLQLGEGNQAGVLTRERIRTMLELQLHQAEAGIVDPQMLQEQIRLQQQNGNMNPSGDDVIELSGANPYATGTPTPGSGYGPGESQNPWTDTTPVPGSGYGPGPGPCDMLTCTPQPGKGPGPNQP